MQLVYVTWEDSSHAGGEWVDLPDAKPDPALVHTCGWLISESTDALLLVDSYTEDVDSAAVGGCLTVTKSSIKDFRVVHSIKTKHHKSKKIKWQ